MKHAYQTDIRNIQKELRQIIDRLADIANTIEDSAPIGELTEQQEIAVPTIEDAISALDVVQDDLNNALE